MGEENRREIVPRALSPHPLLDKVMYSIGCEHAPGEGGVEREKRKRGEVGDHRLASG